MFFEIILMHKLVQGLAALKAGRRLSQPQSEAGESRGGQLKHMQQPPNAMARG